eukprot:COSAG01_NODE_67074_length_268_cov_0.615385_1_plen_73_part_01
MSPAAAATAVAQRGADSAAPKGEGAGKGAQEDAKKGSQNTEMKIGTWNVQALGWGLLQLLLGAACTGDDGNAD